MAAATDKTYYALTMFPYPSGSGLHCGHASVFTVNDVIARYKRMNGYTVLNPFGFDAFGLPTENYAIQQWKPAREVTDINKEKFIDQVKALNMSFDMERIIDTSTPEYYKRTQRIFCKLYDAGLVYKDTLWVNRCPWCQTVLANDQVVEGKCERCKSEITQKKHPQWFIKITDYADRLLEDLDTIDRPEETKTAQRNWIGRSEGAEIDFVVKIPHPNPLPTATLGEGVDRNQTKITCFTTRIDTVYGVTAVVLAPENTMLDELLSPGKRADVEIYRQNTLAKTAVQRQKDLKEKTWVPSGIYVIHPLTGEDIEVWYADYVLADYGTGAVMMVPAHDERDWEFAKKFRVECREVITWGDKNYQFSDSWTWILLPTKIYMSNENVVDLLNEWALNAWLWENYIGNAIWSKDIKIDCYTWPWTLINSREFDWLDHNTAKTKITEHLEQIWAWRKKVTYKLRDRSVSRQRYWGSPIPVYYDENGDHHLVPESELPVVLPLDLENYQPTWKSPLEDHPTFPIYKDIYTRECDTLDTFMCSSFYFLRFPDAGNSEELIRKELADKMLPVDFYTGGKEHTVGHLLYSRFVHKFLYDQWYVSSPEPFTKLVHQGMVQGADGRKMGKRYGNGVDPSLVVEQYGADAVRTYLMFMWPVESDKPWNDASLKGVQKFITKVQKLLTVEWRGTFDESIESLVHETIKGVTSDIENLKLNTVVSKYMILLNAINDKKAVTDEQLSIFARLLAPYACDVAQEIWNNLGEETSVHFAPRPVCDESKIKVSGITLPLSINGKVRAKVEASVGMTEDEAMELARKQAWFVKYIDGKKIRKIIWVQDRMLNVIV